MWSDDDNSMLTLRRVTNIGRLHLKQTQVTDYAWEKP